MASQEVVYTHGSDTGERDSAAIAPIVPGEKVKSAIVDRPLDNLRNRSEVLRDEMIDQKYLQDTDIMWLAADGDAVTGLNPGNNLPQILWDPALGKFLLGPTPGASMILQPIKTPGVDTHDVVTYTFVTDTLAIESIFRNYKGGNRREVRWVWDAGITLTALAVLSGSPDHILTIHVASDFTSTVTDVDNALIALGGALGAAGFSHVVTGGSDFITALPSDYVFTKIFEREMHRIPDSQFFAFFDPLGLNKSLADGDTLAIAYEMMAEPSPGIGGRRQACPTNGNISLMAAQLFITTEEPEKIPIAVPICKRIGDDLIFVDGTVCYGHATPAIPPLYLGEHGYTVERIINVSTWASAAITNQWYGSIPLSGGPTWTINTALNNIIGDLALSSAPSGAARIGMSATTSVPTSLGSYNVPGPGGASIATALLSMIALLNTKASLGLGGVFGAEEIITGRWKFNNHVRMGQHQVLMWDAPADGWWHLVSRNFRSAPGQTETNSEVTRQTYSVYENGNPTFHYGERLEVIGGYSSASDAITSSPDGAGSVFFIKTSNHMSASGGDYIMGVRWSVPASTPLNIYVPSDWDYYQNLKYDSGPSPVEIANHVHGWDGTVTRPLAKQYWHIPQKVENDIDFAGYDTGDVFGEYSRIQVCSLPWSTVLEGMYAQPEDPLNTAIWSPDTIRLSPGRALVNGRPISRVIAPGQLITGLSSKLMNTVVLPTSADDGDSTKIPAWYYLWMRSDRNVFLGKAIPNDNYGTFVPGNSLYRPNPSEVHPGYSMADYTLLDVVYLAQVYNPGTGDEYYWDVAPPCGGTERRFVPRLLPSTGLPIWRHFVIDVADHGAAPVTVSMIQNGTGAGFPRIRVPGYPSGVTEKAIIGYNVEFTLATMGVAGAALVSALLSTNPFFEPAWITEAPRMLWFQSTTNNTSVVVSHGGEFDLTSLVNTFIYTSYLLNDAAYEARFYLEGFHWDRAAGAQS